MSTAWRRDFVPRDNIHQAGCGEMPSKKIKEKTPPKQTRPSSSVGTAPICPHSGEKNSFLWRTGGGGEDRSSRFYLSRSKVPHSPRILPASSLGVRCKPSPSSLPQIVIHRPRHLCPRSHRSSLSGETPAPPLFRSSPSSSPLSPLSPSASSTSTSASPSSSPSSSARGCDTPTSEPSSPSFGDKRIPKTNNTASFVCQPSLLASLGIPVSSLCNCIAILHSWYGLDLVISSLAGLLLFLLPLLLLTSHWTSRSVAAKPRGILNSVC